MTQKRKSFDDEMEDAIGDTIEVNARRLGAAVAFHGTSNMRFNKETLDHFIHLLQKAREVME